MIKTKDSYGITLIALVITIIVMLILVAVTINISVNGGLFEYAQRASNETKIQRDKEMQIANIASGKSADELVNYFTNRISFRIRYYSVTLTCTADKDMTWLDWFKSKYYTSEGLDFDYCIPIQPGYTFPDGLHTTKELKKIQLNYSIDLGDSYPVSASPTLSEKIIENETYDIYILTGV